MTDAAIQPGDIVLVRLPSHHRPSGHEQEGERPAIVVGLPLRSRHPMLIIVPLTTASGQWVKQNPERYPSIAGSESGLPQPFIALLDQIRGVDKTRIKGYVGYIPATTYQPVRQSLLSILKERPN